MIGIVFLYSILFYYLNDFANESRLDLLKLFFPKNLYHLVDVPYATTEPRVKSILYTVVRSNFRWCVPPWNLTSNQSPSIPMLWMQLKKFLIFFRSPGLLGYPLIEMIMISNSEKSYLSLHCFPFRPSMPYWFFIMEAISLHLQSPFSSLSILKMVSSCIK